MVQINVKLWLVLIYESEYEYVGFMIGRLHEMLKLSPPIKAMIGPLRGVMGQARMG